MVRILQWRFWLTQKRNYSGDYRYLYTWSPRDLERGLGFIVPGLGLEEYTAKPFYRYLRATQPEMLIQGPK